jgi:hypothetical protein
MYGGRSIVWKDRKYNQDEINVSENLLEPKVARKPAKKKLVKKKKATKKAGKTTKR